ncbi:hypothetical protein BC835DRAFT_1306479 [Cytidiella melzeri]|nr:hypothetical protein BC835DRAFT_1306479 [Cytidiella melzeri]
MPEALQKKWRHMLVVEACTRKLKGKVRQAVKNEISDNIERELINWLTKQPAHRFSKLLGDSCLDIHWDMIVELLHTYLLGLDKYVWHASHTAWNNAQQQLMQVGVVHLHPNLLESEHGCLLLKIWKATGKLGALLFYHTINDMSTYLEDLDVLIGNLLDVWGAIDPNQILNKLKIHLLQHIITNICNGGPAILFSMEIFKCWKLIFQMCSVLSNHNAPSHNIAAAIADLEHFKYQIQKLFPLILFGNTHNPGFQGLPTCAKRGLGCSTRGHTELSVTETQLGFCVNRLVEVEHFAILGQPDNRLNMPVLYRECASILVDIVPVQKIAFIFNVQHDCLTAECTIEDQSVHQERRITSLTQKVVRHGKMQCYFVNMHALHNAALIQNTLPRHFSKPKPFNNGCAAKHQEFANKVSSVNTTCRDAAAAKAGDTRAHKKQAQELQML